jgi:cytoskeletal protein RodZ
MLKSGYFSPNKNERTDDTMSLANIGQKLKSAREAQGLSLIQVYERTKIPINHLQSVEQGDTDDLPEPVFIFGFIKRYAECVGLDGQVLADEYRSHVDSGSNGRGRKEATPYYASNDYAVKSKPRVSTPTYKLWLFNALIIIGVVGTITWFVNMQQNNIANQPDPSLMSLRNATRGLAPVAPQPNQPAPNTTPVQAPQDTSQKLSLSATRHVWVEVKRISNGESVFTGYLEQGDRRDFEDPQGLIVRAGDGGSLSVDNRGKIETFGLPGKVTERQFLSPVASSGSPATGSTSSTGSGSVLNATGSSTYRAPVVRRPRRVVQQSDTPRVRRETPRRYDSGPTTAPSRYSEGRLDSD